MPLDEAAEGLVVGDDAGNVDIQLLRLPACQQVVEAVLLFGDEDDEALPHRGVGDAPVHLELGGDGLEAAAEFGEVEGQRVGLDLDAHEVALRIFVGVVAGLEDPALVVGDEGGDVGDDADTVGAGGGQGVAALRVHDGRILAEFHALLTLQFLVQHQPFLLRLT